MKKSIVALAVTSAAFASISAYAADDATVSYYGNIQYAYMSSDAQKGIYDDGSSFGFKGESKISDATTAFFNIKLKGYDATQQSVSTIKMDNAQVGVKGDFGKVQIGSFDSVYNDAVQDGLDGSENLSWGKGKTNSGQSGDTVAYYSPSMNGLSFAVGVQSAGKGSSNTAVTGTSTAAQVTYAADMYSVSVGYDANKNSAATNTKSTSGVKVTLMPAANLTVAVKYEKEKDTNTYTALGAKYNYGMGTIYTAYQKVKPNSGSSYNQTELGVNYNVNSSIYVFAETGRSDSVTTSNVGVVYSF